MFWHFLQDRLRYKFNLEISKMIYYTFVHLHLIYGTEMYGMYFTTHTSRDTPVLQLYTIHTLPLPHLHNLQILKFVHNFIHHQNKRI